MTVLYELTFTTDDGEVFEKVRAEGSNFTKAVQGAAETLRKKHNLDLDKTYLSNYKEI